MFFHRIRRSASLAGLAAALALSLPAGSATARPHEAPTALTITPDFASRVNTSRTTTEAAAGEVQVAQNRRQVRRQRQSIRRTGRNQRQSIRQVGRNQRQAIRNQAQRQRAVNRRYVNRRYYNNRWYYYDGDDWYDDDGAIVAAGVIGLAAGAIAGSALAGGYRGNDTVVVIEDGYAAPYTAEWYRLCDQKYRSFRASDGTFLGYDGVRRVCQIP